MLCLIREGDRELEGATERTAVRLARDRHGAEDERQAREYQSQQAEIERTEEFIRRYKAGQRSKQARGRETRLERLERVERPCLRRGRGQRLRNSRLRRGGHSPASNKKGLRAGLRFRRV